MAVDIGPKIGIEGEADFRKALKNINQQIKTLGSEMAAVTSEFAENADEQAKNEKQSEVLTKQIEVQRKKVELLTKAVKESSKKYGDSDTTTLKWKQALYDATTQLNKMESQVDKTENDVDDFTYAVKESEEEIKRYKISISDIGNAISGIAQGIAAGTAAIAAAVSAAIGGATALTIKAGENADEINTLSKQYGMSVEEIQKFQFATEQIDVSLDTLTGSMSRMIKNMEAAKKGTGNAAEAFEALGINVTDSNGELRDSDEVFAEVIAKLGEMENETQRDAYAMEILGKSARDLNPLILGGAEALEEYGKQAEAAGLILDQETLDKLNLVTDAIDTFKATISGAGNLVATEFAEPLAQGVDKATEYIQRLTAAYSEGGISALPDEIMKIMEEIGARIEEKLPDIREYGLRIAGKLATGTIENLPEVISAGSELLLTLLDSLTESLPEIGEFGADAVLAIVDGLADEAPELVPAAVGLVLGIVDTLTEPENLEKLIDAGIALGSGVVGGVLEAAPKLLIAAPEVVLQLITGLIGEWPEIFDAGGDLVKQLIGGIDDWKPELREGGESLLDDLENVWDTGINTFKTVGRNIVDKIKFGLDDADDGIANMATTFINELYLALTDGESMESKMKKVGGEIVNGIWEGITGAGDWLWEKISDFGGDIVDAFKYIFDINSPSKVFENEVGRYMAQGIGEGFTHEMRSVANQMTRSIPTPEIAMNGAASGLINGIQTAMIGMTGQPTSLNIIVQLDTGEQVAHAFLPNLRAAMKSDPEVVTA